MERFAAIINGFKLLTTVAKFSILDVRGSPGHFVLFSYLHNFYHPQFSHSLFHMCIWSLGRQAGSRIFHFHSTLLLHTRLNPHILNWSCPVSCLRCKNNRTLLQSCCKSLLRKDFLHIHQHLKNKKKNILFSLLISYERSPFRKDDFIQMFLWHFGPNEAFVGTFRRNMHSWDRISNGWFCDLLKVRK